MNNSYIALIRGTPLLIRAIYMNISKEQVEKALHI